MTRLRVKAVLFLAVLAIGGNVFYAARDTLDTSMTQRADQLESGLHDLSQTDQIEAHMLLQSAFKVMMRQLDEATEKDKYHGQPTESAAPSPEHLAERSILQSEILVMQQKLARATTKNEEHGEPAESAGRDRNPKAVMSEDEEPMDPDDENTKAATTIAVKSSVSVKRGREPEAVLSPLQFPMHSSQWLDDIGSVVQCGYHKCAHASKASLTYDSDNPNRIKYGYLISQERTVQAQGGKHRSSQVLEWTADKAQQLSRNYAIKHLLIGRPKVFNVNVTKGAIENLTKTLSGKENQMHSTKGKPGMWLSKYKELLKATKELIVQPIKLASEGSIVWCCWWGLGKDRKNANDQVKRIATKHNKLSPPALKQMIDTMLFDLKATQKMMANRTDGLCLEKDFQVMVDVIGGGIYQIDLDRCFSEGRNMTTQKAEKTAMNHQCWTNLREFLNNVLVHRGKPGTIARLPMREKNKEEEKVSELIVRLLLNNLKY